MQHTTKTEDPILATIKADNQQAWADLKPGYNRLFLSPALVKDLKELHRRGVLSDLHAPAVHMTACLHAFVTRRERDTRQNDAGRTQLHPLPPGGSSPRAARALDAAAASTPQQEAA